MTVQELIDALANYRADAQVVFWHHNELAGVETMHVVESVARDNVGTVGINWSEDAKEGQWATGAINNT